MKRIYSESLWQVSFWTVIFNYRTIVEAVSISLRFMAASHFTSF